MVLDGVVYDEDYTYVDRIPIEMQKKCYSMWYSLHYLEKLQLTAVYER